MRVLYIGETPETADLKDPAIPPGTTVETLQAGIDAGVAEMRGRGWDADFCGVPPDPAQAADTVRAALAAGQVDVVVMGGGLRVPASRVALFEALVNLLRTEATATEIAFNTAPGTTAEAVQRRLDA